MLDRDWTNSGHGQTLDKVWTFAKDIRSPMAYKLPNGQTLDKVRIPLICGDDSPMTHCLPIGQTMDLDKLWTRTDFGQSDYFCQKLPFTNGVGHGWALSGPGVGHDWAFKGPWLGPEWAMTGPSVGLECAMGGS